MKMLSVSRKWLWRNSNWMNKTERDGPALRKELLAICLSQIQQYILWIIFSRFRKIALGDHELPYVCSFPCNNSAHTEGIFMKFGSWVFC
jgi:hypothetical protein